MKALLFLVAIAIPICAGVNLTRPATHHAETMQEPKPPEVDARSRREVQELAKQFARRLEETREFKPDGDKLFIERFLDCHLSAELKGQENGIFRQIGGPLKSEVASQAGKDELRRYLLAQLNFFHLLTLHRMSTRDLNSGLAGSFSNRENDYPPNVLTLLMKNPVLAPALSGTNEGQRIDNVVKSIQDLRSVLPALEEAILVMREHFSKQRPEKTELYKKNLELIGKDGNNSKFGKASFQEISEQLANEGRECLGFHSRLMAIVTVPPFYNLIIFKTDNGFKVGSLFCTEPPCVD